MTTKKLKNPAAVELGRLGGLVKSEKKAQAARENGKKGGRPKHPIMGKTKWPEYLKDIKK